MNVVCPPFTYILPLRSALPLINGELAAYLARLARRCEVIVVDGSEPAVFEEHHAAWGGSLRHVAPSERLVTPMGKVGGVLTGLELASHERIVIADDDVRYDDIALTRIVHMLSHADVVRPQNYFTPLPWHAVLDTGRILLNRLSGGDWPGTLAVRRSILLRTGGYDGRAMFENLELVRTVRAAGGRELVPLDLFVARRPSTTPHFLSQRVRQAYDELARPARLAFQLAILPVTVAITWRFGAVALLAAAVAVMIAAWMGRRRAHGATVFPLLAIPAAPLWVVERAICSWLALFARITLGGVPYRGQILSHAATPMRELQARFAMLSPRRRSA